MKRFTYHFKKDRKIITLIMLWFILAFFVAWNAETLFMLIIPIFLLLLLTYPILFIFISFQTYKNKLSMYPLMLLIIFSIIAFILPIQEWKAKDFYNTYKQELKILSEESNRYFKNNTLEDTNLTIDNTNVTSVLVDKHYYLLIVQNGVMLSDSSEWLVYASNGKPNKNELPIKIKTIKKIDDNYFYITGEFININE